MISETIAVRDLDTIYLTYDEPQKEEFWVKIKNMIPWAKRVDGVKGSDSAHKAAANCSETERFILIDGDNLPDEKFFELDLKFNDISKNAQLRWRAKNCINNLYYGNGGISSWTKTHVLNMRTHENTDGHDKTVIEFCFDPLYWPMHDCYSTTYINYTPKQAWRAGFREGIKLCTRNGIPPKSADQFTKYVWQSNLRTLTIWQNIGRDIKNGLWAILGARTGTHYLMLNNSWDYVNVRDFSELDSLWEKHCNDDEKVCENIGQELKRYLGIDIVEFNHEQSEFYKKYNNIKWTNIDPMKREIENYEK